jgi:hypothetical protein
MDLFSLFERTTSVITPVLLLMGMMLAYSAYSQWRRDRQKRDEREERLHYEAVARQERDASTSVGADAAAGPAAGGYIILNLPDEQKALFHDVLKGFEEYAGMKGYSIQFSIDNSAPNQIAFKFTVAGAGIQVSSQQVRSDFDEYMEKVRSGDPLNDLPAVIPEVQHRSLLLAMQNRINFLHHTYTAQTNVVSITNDSCAIFAQLGRWVSFRPRTSTFKQEGPWCPQTIQRLTHRTSHRERTILLQTTR